MSNVDDLVAWLREQITAVETSTRTLLYWAQQTILTLQDPKLLGKHIPGWHDWPDVEKMCQQRLTELDAKRRILALHPPRYAVAYRESDRLLAYAFDHDRVGTVGVSQPIYDPELRLLALPYADRPGYREEWRP